MMIYEHFAPHQVFVKSVSNTSLPITQEVSYDESYSHEYTVANEDHSLKSRDSNTRIEIDTKDDQNISIP